MHTCWGTPHDAPPVPLDAPLGALAPASRASYGDHRMKPLLAPEIERYAHDHTTLLSPLLDELREVTLAKTKNPEMQVGRVEGMLLETLVALAGAKRVLEIGT